jgi:heme-degrading monooxygenase HmoA
MTTDITPEDRTAPATVGLVEGGVTLINRFAVPAGRDDEFRALWETTSRYFIAQPGFVSLRLHRAVSEDAPYRFVNVAVWEREEDYRRAHSTDEFRRVVTAPGWAEFPSEPALYEVVKAIG